MVASITPMNPKENLNQIRYSYSALEMCIFFGHTEIEYVKLITKIIQLTIRYTNITKGVVALFIVIHRMPIPAIIRNERKEFPIISADTTRFWL